MLKPGNPAPSFDCNAIVDHEVVEFNWSEVHERRTIVLQFDSIESYTALPDGLVAMINSAGDFRRLQAKLALVSRDHVFEILEWANRSADEGGPGEIVFPVIVDSDERIASMYDMLDADGCSIWGHVIVDPVGRVREIARSSIQIVPNVDELIRCVTSINNERS